MRKDEITGAVIVGVIGVLALAIYYQPQAKECEPNGYVKVPKEMFSDIFQKGLLDTISEITPDTLNPIKKGKR